MQAIIEHVSCPRVTGGGGREQTWGGAEKLLGARVHAVHAPVISKEGNAAQTAHCVHQQQCAMLVAQLTQACQALVHPCAALPLQLHTQTLRPYTLQPQLHDPYSR